MTRDRAEIVNATPANVERALSIIRRWCGVVPIEPVTSQQDKK